jgi:hypothetical protein
MDVVRFAVDWLGGEVCSWKAILVILQAGLLVAAMRL